jgi:Trk-type K+ transport system membrane component
LTGLLLASVTVGGLALAFLDRFQRPGLDYLFEATSAIGCVGLSVGLTGPELDTAAKLVLTALMWIGRLEVVAVAVLLTTPISIEARRLVGDARLKRMAGQQPDGLDGKDTSQADAAPVGRSDGDST